MRVTFVSPSSVDSREIEEFKAEIRSATHNQ